MTLKTILTFSFLVFSVFLKAQNLTLDLEVYLKLDSNLADSSGNNNNPTNNSGTFTTDKFGNSNSALRFSSSNSEYLFIPNNGILNTEYSVSFWAKLESLPGNSSHFVVVSLGGSTKESGISVTNNYFGYSGWGNYTGSQNNTYAYANGTLPTSGQWYFVTSVRDNSTIKLYVNGALQSSISATETSLFTGGNIGVYVGKRADNSAFSDISLDEIRVYSRALSLIEVQNLYSVSNTIETFETPFEFQVFPNPGYGKVNIKLSEGQTIGSLKIFDMAGRELDAQIIRDQNNAEITFLNKGLYILQIISEDGHLATKKVVINE